MPPLSKRHALVQAARQLALQHRDQLEELKQGARDLDRPDFVWHFLLQAFSTWGSSHGWKHLMHNPKNYDQVTWQALQPLSREARIARTEAVFRAAKMRYAPRKAGYLADNMEIIQSWGGLSAARKRLFSASGHKGKIRVLKELKGIGDKYARNIMMDVYHPDFHHRIAIDERIKRVLEAVNAPDGTYAAQEAWLLSVAEDAGLNGWEFDRLMYHHRDAFLAAVNAISSVPQQADQPVVASLNQTPTQTSVPAPIHEQLPEQATLRGFFELLLGGHFQAARQMLIRLIG